MSSDSGQSFWESWRERRRQQQASRKRSTEGLDPSDSEDAFEYHQRKIRQEADEASESGPFYLTASEEMRFGVLVALFFAGFVGSVMVMPIVTPTMASFYGLLLGGGGYFFLTRNGVAIRRAFSDINMNGQQQTQSTSGPKRTCPHCGWQNPKGNNYCHDCGEKLDTE